MPGVALDRGRVVGIDLWRVIAALGIVWVHVIRSPDADAHKLWYIGYWGTAFLNLLGGYFVVYGLNKAVNSGDGLWRFGRHRLARLGGAFVLWSLIYIAARGVNYLVFGKITTLQLDWNLLYLGTEYHLWFLPHLLLLTFLSAPIVLVSVRTPERSLWTGVAFALAAVVVTATLRVSYSPDTIDLGTFLMKVAVRSPGFMFGLAFGLWSLHGRLVQPGWGTVAVCVGVVIATMLLGMTTDLPRSALVQTAAVAAFIASQAPWSGRMVQLFSRLGTLGFGVYLAHVLFVEGALAILRVAHVPPTIATDIGMFVFVSAVSFAFAWAVKRNRAFNWLVP